MKLPFDFATKLIFRLILPGLILAAALAPGVRTFLHWGGISAGFIEILSFGVVFWGWMVVIADMPIYMLYEGRRFWPEPLRLWGLARERKRLAKLKRAMTPAVREGNYRLFMESQVEYLNFPLGDSGQAEVRFPTRLGNLMTAYETYPSKKYGIDAIFYWYRLWVVIDKDLREEMDNQQALADSPVYVSFALCISALAFVAYALATWCFGLAIAYIQSPGPLLLLASSCVAGAVLFYRVSLFAHAQYGELFKSLFDQHRSKLCFPDVISKLSDLMGDPNVSRSQTMRNIE